MISGNIMLNAYNPMTVIAPVDNHAIADAHSNIRGGGDKAGDKSADQIERAPRHYQASPNLMERNEPKPPLADYDRAPNFLPRDEPKPPVDNYGRAPNFLPRDEPKPSVADYARAPNLLPRDEPKPTTPFYLTGTNKL